MKYIKKYNYFINESNLVDSINNRFKKLFGSEYNYVEISGGILLPTEEYNKLSEEDKNFLNTSLGMSVTYSEDLIKELSPQEKIGSTIEKPIEEPIQKKSLNKDNYYFLRWTHSPEDDEKRNFSGHMQSWVNTEEEAWESRNDEIENENREFSHEPKKDPVSGMWNYDPEWGVSGYLFKDEESFNNAMENIKDISWYHRDDNKQELALFSASEIGGEHGYDGEELFRNINFIDYVDENTTYEQIRYIINQSI